MQPLLLTEPSVPGVAVAVSGPQLSVNVAEPRAPLIVGPSGLQPGITPFDGFPVVANVGAVKSEVHVAVRDALAVLPHASVTFHVLV